MSGGILDKFRLDGKTAFVTGASDGIGQAIARAYAEAGADIATVYRSDITKTKKLIEETGRSFFAIKDDLAADGAVDRVFDAIMEKYGRIDILFNNAGCTHRVPCLEFDEEDWNRVIHLDLTVLFFLSRRVAAQMVEKGIHGKIISTASILSFQGGIHSVAYTAAKTGVKGITMTMANEWAKHGINVNAIAPGYIETKLTEHLRNDPERMPSIMERIPLGRWGTPEDLKGVALFLASEASGYMTGVTIPVDGGWLSR